MAFRLRFGGVTLVRGSDTAAVVVVGGDTVRVFRDLVGAGDTVSVAAPDTQMAANGRTRWRFVSWSDGQPRVHAIVGTAAGDTLIATLARDFRVAVTVQGGGTVIATPAIEAGRHRFTSKLAKEPLPLHADPERLAQVFANVLNNAAKYSDPGGSIHLEARRDGDTAVVLIRDQGIGLSADQLDTVFELFRQVDTGVAIGAPRYRSTLVVVSCGRPLGSLRDAARKYRSEAGARRPPASHLLPQ